MKIIHPREQRKLIPFPPKRDRPAKRQHHVKPISESLFVFTAISNPNRYYTRYKLFREWEDMVWDSGGIPIVIELALRDRHFEVTDPAEPRHIQVRSHAQLWHKEQLINRAVEYVTNYYAPEMNYIAWVDADVDFARPDWVNETLHQLQHYKVVQMFSHAQDLTPDFVPVMDKHGIPVVQTGFMYQYVRGEPHPHRVNSGRGRGHEEHGQGHGHGHDHHDHGKPGQGHYPYLGHRLWHPGYAWAARRSAFSDLGQLGDIAILGSGDHHMACALIGMVDVSIHRDMHQTYKDYWNSWQGRAERYINRNVGYVPGLINHFWHGPKRKRGYVDRWKILVEEQFNYLHDLTRDAQGLWQLTEDKPRLRDRIREYFRQRDEDDIRVD